MTVLSMESKEAVLLARRALVKERERLRQWRHPRAVVAEVRRLERNLLWLARQLQPIQRRAKPR